MTSYSTRTIGTIRAMVSTEAAEAEALRRWRAAVRNGAETIPHHVIEHETEDDPVLLTLDVTVGRHRETGAEFAAAGAVGLGSLQVWFAIPPAGVGVAKAPTPSSV